MADDKSHEADTSWITDEMLVEAAERESAVWAETQFHGIPRCVAFPYSGPCCGKFDEEGNLTGICPPPNEGAG